MKKQFKTTVDKVMSYIEENVNVSELKQIDMTYHFSKGVNAGRWGSIGTPILIEGDLKKGRVAVEVKGKDPRTNMPHVKIDFNVEFDILNGIIIPNRNIMDTVVRKYNSFLMYGEKSNHCLPNYLITDIRTECSSPRFFIVHSSPRIFIAGEFYEKYFSEKVESMSILTGKSVEDLFLSGHILPEEIVIVLMYDELRKQIEY